MKQRIRQMILLLSCVIFVYAGIQVTLALGRDPGVLYDGKKEAFTFINTEETDLFREFKDVIPGDVLTQKIKIYCQNISSTTKLFLRASIDDNVDLPEDITLTVYSGENIISHGAADTVNGLDDYVLLGTFPKDGEMELSVVLTVPTSIGNEISYVEKNIDWQLAVQVLGEDKEPIAPPQTGDDNVVCQYVIIMAICIIACFFALKKRGKTE